MWTCSNCKEELEEEFDSCWQCGTARDGSPPKNPEIFQSDEFPTGLEERLMGLVECPPCINCGSDHVLYGRIGRTHFFAQGMRLFTLSLSRPDILVSEEACLCINCGLLWTNVDKEEAYKTLETWGDAALQQQLLNWRGDQEVLLRPTDAEASASEQLLHPASATEESDSEQLLRADPAPPVEKPMEDTR